MRPGVPEAFDIAFSPVAAMIGKGHRLRIAIAGADDGNLERLPAAGPEVFTIQRNAHGASMIDLPVLATPP
jgi:hypothetical protein